MRGEKNANPVKYIVDIGGARGYSVTIGNATGDFEINVTSDDEKQHSSNSPVEYASDTDSTDEMDMDAKKPSKTYSNFVQNLLAHHPEMSEAINDPPERPTACDMWKRDAQRQQEASARFVCMLYISRIQLTFLQTTN